MIMPMLSVQDVDRAVAFYRDKLGFEVQVLMQGPSGKNEFAIVIQGESHIGLGMNPETDPGKGVSFMIYVPEATDLDSYYATVKQNGVGIEVEIKTEYWGDRVFAIKDPDGYSLQFCKTVEQTDMEYASAVMRGDIKPE